VTNSLTRMVADFPERTELRNADGSQVCTRAPQTLTPPSHTTTDCRDANRRGEQLVQAASLRPTHPRPRAVSPKTGKIGKPANIRRTSLSGNHIFPCAGETPHPKVRFQLEFVQKGGGVHCGARPCYSPTLHLSVARCPETSHTSLRRAAFVCP